MAIQWFQNMLILYNIIIIVLLIEQHKSIKQKLYLVFLIVSIVSNNTRDRIVLKI